MSNNRTYRPPIYRCIAQWMIALVPVVLLCSDTLIAQSPLRGPAAQFVSNAGQWNPGAQYGITVGGLNAWFAGNGVVYELRNANATGYVVQQRFVGMQEGAWEGYGASRTSWNYIYATERFTAKGCSEVRRQDIYKGISARYYLHEGTLKYDLMVAPHADPSQIVLGYDGARSVRIASDGSLRVGVDGGELRELAPYCYQETEAGQKAVEGRFVRVTGGFGIATANYDRTKPLIIDPALIYSSYIGGISADSAQGITVDAKGSMYVTGNTASADFPVTLGALRTVKQRGTDLFVTRLNASGTAMYYATYIGGNGDESAAGIAIDSNGGVIVAGTTSSNDFPVTFGAAFRNPIGGTDGFVLKLNPTGSALDFSTFFGGSSNDRIEDLTVDSRGNIYVTGGTISNDLPVTRNAADTVYNGGEDAFVVKFNPNGSKALYVTYLGGSGDDRALGIAVTPRSVAYVTGWTASFDYPVTATTLDATPNGGRDGFVSMIDSAGTLIGFSTYLGGSDEDEPADIALDSLGAIYLTGRSASVDFPTTIPATSGSWFITKLASPGTSIAFSRHYGANDGGSGLSIRLDKNLNIYLCGITSSASFPTTPDAVTGSPRGGADVAFVELSPVGIPIHSSVIGGTEDEMPSRANALDRFGNMYAVGATSSLNFPLTRAAMDSTLTDTLNSPTRSDGFIMRFGFKRTPSILSPYSIDLDTLRCETEVLDTFYIHNTGDGDLVVNGIFFQVNDLFYKVLEPDQSLSFTIAPRDSLRCIIRFQSSLANSVQNTLLVFSNDPIAGKSPDSVHVTAVRAAPVVSTVSAAVNYPPILSCQTSPRDTVITITNTGFGAVDVQSARLAVPGNSGMSIVTAPSFPLHLNKNVAFPLRLRFTPPGRAGTYRDTIIVALTQCNFVLRLPVSIRVDSLGLDIPGNQLSFDTLAYCGTSVDSVLTLKNTGSVPFTINGTINNSVFQLLDVFPITLQPDSTARVRIRFIPNSSGTAGGTLQLLIPGCDGSRDIPLLGVRTVKNIVQPDADSVLFGTLSGCAKNPTRADTVIHLHNTGTRTLRILQPVINPPFSLLSPTIYPVDIPPGNTLDLRFRYQPQGSGNDTESIVLLSSDGPCTDTIRLTLRGAYRATTVQSGIGSVDFGMLDECTGYRDSVIYFHNNSDVPVTVDSVQEVGAGKHFRPTLPFTVPAHDSVAVFIRLQPQSAGAASGSVTYLTEACRDSISINVSGLKQGIALSFNPPVISLPTLARCASGTGFDTIVVLRNLGSAQSTARIVSETVQGDSGFSIDQSVIGKSVNGNDSVSIPIHFAPQTTGIFHGIVELVLAPCGDTLRLPISGEIADPTLTVTGNDFGTVQVNTTRTSRLVLHNTSAFAIRIDSLSNLQQPFKLAGTNPFPVTIAPGDSIAVDIQFGPANTGNYSSTPFAVLSSPCPIPLVVLLSGQGIDTTRSDTVQLCSDGIISGLVGDTIEIDVRSAATQNLVSVRDILYTFIYNSLRLQLVGTGPGQPADIVESRTGDDTLRVRQRGVSQMVPVQLRLRFRLLAGAEREAGLRLQSVTATGGPFVVMLCPDSVRIRISDKCIVTGVRLGKYRNVLEPVSPNPAGGVVQISYQQLEDAHTVLRLWDATGREVMRPLDQQMQGGRYTVRIDVGTLPSGIYLYSIEAGNYREARTLVIER